MDWCGRLVWILEKSSITAGPMCNPESEKEHSNIEGTCLLRSWTLMRRESSNTEGIPPKRAGVVKEVARRPGLHLHCNQSTPIPNAWGCVAVCASFWTEQGGANQTGMWLVLGPVVAVCEGVCSV